MPQEARIINMIRSRVKSGAGTKIGIGDDAAVLQGDAGLDWLFCSDMLVEDVHFRSEWADPYCLGRKALSVSLSDIAAMGGVPRFALLSVAFPPGFESRRIEALFEGVIDVAKESGVDLVGGDTSRSSGPLCMDTSVLGQCRSGFAVTRAGARAGDRVFVTGQLGASALGLSILEREGSESNPRKSSWRERAVRRHLNPEPRLREGAAIGESRLANAMIDISDGLSTDLRHILDESRCGAVLRAATLPVDGSVIAANEEDQSLDPLELVLSSGEEYELLFTLPPDRVPALHRLFENLRSGPTEIGEITEGRQLLLETEGRLEEIKATGHQHVI